MTTINSLTTSLYVSQTTISISSTASTQSDDQQHSAVNGRGEEKHGHHHSGGGFMHNVVQALQSFGLSIPGGNSDSSAGDNNNTDGGQTNSSSLGQLLQTFLQDLRQVLKQSGVQQPGNSEGAGSNAAQSSPQQSGSAAVTPTTATPAGQAASTSVQNNVANPSAATSSAATAVTSTVSATSAAPNTTAADVRQALHSFLHDLRQALKYSADLRQASSYSDDGGSGLKTVGRNGYGRFTDNLQSLITALSDSAGSVSGKYKELQDSFDSLMSVLGTAANGKKPTLLEFLNKLAGNGESSTPVSGGAGSIVSATA
jgi:hypothetical protein